MLKRKQYIVDKSFQLKTTFTIIGFIFACVALLTVLIGLNVFDTNKKIDNVRVNEDMVVQVLADTAANAPDSDQVFTKSLFDNHRKNLDTMRGLIRINNILLLIIILITFLQGVVLFFVLIRQTHRIAGPLYVMNRYMREIINGHVPDHLRPLRDRDLLKDFYGVFQEMVYAIKDRFPAQSSAARKPSVVKTAKPAAKKAVKKAAKKK